MLTPEGKTFELLKIKDTETTTTGRSQKSAVDPYIVSVSNNSIYALAEKVKESYILRTLNLKRLKVMGTILKYMIP